MPTPSPEPPRRRFGYYTGERPGIPVEVEVRRVYDIVMGIVSAHREWWVRSSLRQWEDQIRGEIYARTHWLTYGHPIQLDFIHTPKAGGHAVVVIDIHIDFWFHYWSLRKDVPMSAIEAQHARERANPYLCETIQRETENYDLFLAYLRSSRTGEVSLRPGAPGADPQV